MDPSYGAYGRIRLFLADLNLVLGHLPTMSTTPYSPAPNFNRIGVPENFDCRGPRHQLSSSRPTTRSRAWRKKHPKIPAENFRHEQRTPRLELHTERFRYKKPREHMVPLAMIQRSDDINSAERQSCDPTIDVRLMSNLEERSGHCQAPQYSFGEGESGLGDDLANDYYGDQDEVHEPDEIDLDEIEWDDRSDLDINATPDSYQPDQSLTSDAIPEDYVDQFIPEANSIHQPEPDFDLKNYSAEDVNCWASTLSADKFEHLRMMGPNARTESFRQYATLHIDQSTRPHSPLNSLPSQSNQALHNQNIYPTTNEINNHCIPSHHPDQFNPSNYYEHSNYCANDLDENPENKSVLDDSSFNGVFDNSGFDDGGYNNCGFDDGRSDDDGFDDGGFDDGGFDDGGFDDGGFDDGGFDDGYGSTY
ncbi:hypothetical protein PGT21_034281 [Puccinia graminis f. sp. tritici]|uniref:Uncharacterized protein n=1 Tax=Puccinia graminis f. sp. tritici TaxID=56615 RepID=A0A5B0N0S5_PUCGR|nr:hypothetical protein PGT21_034281 [Puccinia graminis f. sp. tritici]KAA1081798.1 hypothetical protein PGTUg99_009326 [Puccinia graminis f. sp. tritici]